MNEIDRIHELALKLNYIEEALAAQWRKVDMYISDGGFSWDYGIGSLLQISIDDLNEQRNAIISTI